MSWDFPFFANSALLGVGLAMDAFSVSLADGLNEPRMGRARGALIAGTFALFQFLMPMIGWLCVRTVAEAFAAFQRAVPWIALALLGWIGGKMLYEGSVRRGRQEEAGAAVGGGALLMQGVATSIDALSVGFTIEGYGLSQALAASAIIAAVTFCICAGGLLIGRKFGTRLAGSASLLGGAILVLIGLEIFLKNLQ
ncbi:MAG: manganese efflux pump [Clostridia bacterium]|nr:manganese efflux pump [Clostridia bacterium]